MSECVCVHACMIIYIGCAEVEVGMGGIHACVEGMKVQIWFNMGHRVFEWVVFLDRGVHDLPKFSTVKKYLILTFLKLIILYLLSHPKKKSLYQHQLIGINSHSSNFQLQTNLNSYKNS